MGMALGLLPPEAQSYIVAGAILSIVANPLIFRLVALPARRTARVNARAGSG